MLFLIVTAACGFYSVELSDNQLKVFKTSGSQSASIIVAKTATLAGDEIQSNGIDIQTDETKDWVALEQARDSDGKRIEGQYRVTYKDHRLTPDGYSIPDYQYFPCDEQANAILTAVAAQAK